MRTNVACLLTVSSPVPARALLQVAVAAPAEEQLTVLTDGAPREAEEVVVDGARVHRLELPAGDTTITYSAQVESGGDPREVTSAEWAEYVRPSRYCPADQLAGFAATEFDRSMPRAGVVGRVASWVHERLV